MTGLTSHTPHDQDALRTILSNAPAESLKPVGSLTSKSRCFETNGLMIHCAHFKEINVQEDGVVQVGSGVLLVDLLEVLTAHQLALPTIGEWYGQTLGGAISTGTHGGSYVHGSLVSSVRSITLIDGLGVLRHLTRDDPAFVHAVPAFGLTGVAISYELQCDPIFSIALERNLLSFDSYLQTLLDVDDAEFRASIWLPALDQVLDYAGNRSELSVDGVLTKRETRFNTPTLILDWLSKQLARSGRDLDGLGWRGRCANQIAKFAYLCLPSKSYAGIYHDMIAPLSGDAAKILAKRARNRTPPEGEFAVSLNRVEELLLELRRYFADTGHYPDRPIGLRPAAAETGTLFATQGEACVWVSLFIYAENPLMALIPKLLMKYEARPHWGKCVFHPLDEIHHLYKDWSEFLTHRAQFDPQRQLINQFAKDLGI
jgi:L-gulono-1,4-lactone dehydrogenase